MGLLAKLQTAGKIAATTIERKSPEICLVVSLAGIAGTVYFVYKATKDIRDAKMGCEDYAFQVNLNSALSDEKKDELITEYNKQYKKYCAKKIAPAAASLVLATTGVLGVYGILKTREARALAVAASTKMAFDIYRNRNREKYGEEADQYCMYGTEQQEVTVKDSETGKKEKIKRTVKSNDGDLANPFAFLFAPFDYEHRTGSKYYEPDVVYNENMIKILEGGFVTRYEAGEPIFLCDVYKAFGIDYADKLKQYGDAIQKMGWWKGHEPNNADGYFDLRITQCFNKPDPGYGEESESVVWIIDPNCSLIV